MLLAKQSSAERHQEILTLEISSVFNINSGKHSALSIFFHGKLKF